MEGRKEGSRKGGREGGGKKGLNNWIKQKYQQRLNMGEVILSWQINLVILKCEQLNTVGLRFFCSEPRWCLIKQCTCHSSLIWFCHTFTLSDHYRGTWLPWILFMEHLLGVTLFSVYVRMKLPCGPVSENPWELVKYSWEWAGEHYMESEVGMPRKSQ